MVGSRLGNRLGLVRLCFVPDDEPQIWPAPVVTTNAHGIPNVVEGPVSAAISFWKGPVLLALSRARPSWWLFWEPVSTVFLSA